MPTSAPTVHAPLFDDEQLTNPYHLYERLRAAGPVVAVEDLDIVAVTGFDEVTSVLGN